MLNLGGVLVLMLMRAGILFSEVGVVAATAAQVGMGGRGGDVFCLLLLLKSQSASGTCHHPAFMAAARLLVTRF